MARLNKKAENMVQRKENLNQVSLSDFGYRQPVDPRRMPEINDSRLIQEDQQAIANLPMNAIHREFRPGKYLPNYWMESEVEPVGVQRYNEPEEL
jgi:hypothetical protein